MSITLVKFTHKDFNDYYELVGNNDVMQMITEYAYSVEEAKSKFSEILTNNKLHDSFGNFRVIDEETDQFIGSALLKITSTDTNEAEIGYMLLPEYWGKGIGSQIAAQLLLKAKNESQITLLNAVIDPNNIASRKILTNMGFISKEVRMMDGLPGEKLSMKIR